MRECPICKKSNPDLEFQKHHINSLSKGGSNSSWNLVKLCTNCHSTVHNNLNKQGQVCDTGKIIIEGWFFSIPKGDILVWRKRGQESITGCKDPDVHLRHKIKKNKWDKLLNEFLYVSW